jgi:hypothetical protein
MQKLLEGKIQAPNDEFINSSDLQRILSLSGITSDNPASPSFTGKIVETTATVIRSNLKEYVNNDFANVLNGFPERYIQDICNDYNIDCMDMDKEDMINQLSTTLSSDEQDDLINSITNIEDDEHVIVDRDFERQSDYDPTMLTDDLIDVEIDEAIQNDYGHRRRKPTFQRRIDAFDHKAFALDADKPDKFKSPRFGSNPMSNPTQKNESIVEGLNEQEGQLFLKAIHKAKQGAASTITESEMIAFANGFIAMLESETDNNLRNIHKIFKK